MNELTCVILNAVLYTYLFYNRWKKEKTLSLSIIMLGFWSISALGAIYYEPINIFGHKGVITMLPYFYLFVCNILFFIPVFRYDYNCIKNIQSNDKLVYVICIIIGLLALYPLVINITYLVRHLDTVGYSSLIDNFQDRYDDQSLTYYYMDSICYRLTRYSHYLWTVSLVLLFYIPLSKIRNKKICYITLIIGIANLFVESINIMARFSLVIYFIIIFTVYILFKHLYNEKIKAKINKVILALGIGLLSVFAVITIVRLEFRNETRINQVSEDAYVMQYLSEGMGNFNANMFHADYQTNRDVFTSAFNFYILKQGEMASDREMSTLRFGFQSYLFYTLVGDFCRGYGIYFSFIIILLICLFFSHTLQATPYTTLSKILLFVYYIRLPLTGMFYNTYAATPIEAISIPMFVILFKLFEQQKKKKFYGV